MKPFEWKTIKEIWLMVFGKEKIKQLQEWDVELILKKFGIDQDITERQIIWEDNINRAYYFAHELIRMRKIFDMMDILKKHGV